ncbi:MAG: CPBP family intramembrane glutamic endopeptidase [Lutisporaceae bacterium]
MMKYLKMVGKIVLYLGSVYLMMTIMSLFVNALIGMKVIQGELYKWIYENQSLLMIPTIVIVMLMYLLVFKLRKKSFTEFCEIKKISFKSVALLFTIALSMGIFTTAFTSMSFILEKFPELDSTINFFMGNGNVIVAILTSVLIIPAYEEVLFRGLIFNELRNNMAIPIAFLIQNLIYAIIQPNLMSIIFGFIGGFIFSLAYLWVKSLWAPILLQTISCFFMLFFRRLGVHLVFRGIGDIAIIIVLIAAVFTITYIMLSFRKDSKKLSQDLNNLSI